MVADVAVGSFLSGGIDSTTVSAIIQKNSLKKIKTFSIGFEEASYNEAEYAKEIANYLKEGLKPHPDKMLLPSLVKKILPLYLGDIVLYGSVIDKGFQKMSKWIDLSDIR